MPFALKEFPKNFPIAQNGTVRKKARKKFTLDETRLLVAFAKRMDRQAAETLLGTCGLKLEDAGEREIQEELAGLVESCCTDLRANPDRRKRFGEQLRQQAMTRAKECQCFAVPDLSQRVAHTTSCFWVRSDKPIDQQQVNQLVKNPTNKIRWIAPVYQDSSRKGRNGLFSPLPGVLVLQLAKSVSEPVLTKKLRELGLRKIKARSRPLGKLCYAMLYAKALQRGVTVYGLLQRLRQAKQLIRGAWLENIPLLSTTSNTYLPYNPDDPYFQNPNPWNLNIIEAEKGWGIVEGYRQEGRQLYPVTICILDTDGVDIEHEEFQDRVVNPYTVPGADTDPDNPLPPGQAEQEQPHGTKCAGVATATMNNQKGLAGLAGWPDIFSLMPVRVGGSALSWASGIRYAADAGADVISISMNDEFVGEPDVGAREALDEAITYAVRNKGAVVCVSSGNGNQTGSVQYPASHPDVIACGAINQLGKRCEPGDWPSIINGGSSHGRGLSVVAPGVFITTTTTRTRGQNGYSFAFGGTSAATPHVAGLAALLLSVDPNLRPAQVRQFIRDSATRLDGYVPKRGRWHKEVGYGLINVSNALSQLG